MSIWPTVPVLHTVSTSGQQHSDIMTSYQSCLWICLSSTICLQLIYISQYPNQLWPRFYLHTPEHPCPLLQPQSLTKLIKSASSFCRLAVSDRLKAIYLATILQQNKFITLAPTTQVIWVHAQETSNSLYSTWCLVLSAPEVELLWRFSDIITFKENTCAHLHLKNNGKVEEQDDSTTLLCSCGQPSLTPLTSKKTIIGLIKKINFLKLS